MAVAYAVNNGTDIELGSTEFLAHLKEAVDRNLTTEATVTESVHRVFAQWFSAGRFDSLEDFAYAHIGPDQVGCSSLLAKRWICVTSAAVRLNCLSLTFYSTVL